MSDPTGWWWVYYYDMAPGKNSDVLRTWTAPPGFNENVSLTGNIYQEVAGAATGAQVWVERTPANSSNPTIIWGPKTLVQGDRVGYDLDGDLTGFYTAAFAGDKFSFVVDCNGAEASTL